MSINLKRAVKIRHTNSLSIKGAPEAEAVSNAAQMVRKSFSFEVKDVQEDGTFSGYGSVYDVIDQGDDIVSAGAFTDSLKEWKQKDRMPALLWQHNSDEPIGVYVSMKEDETGLFVQGQLCMDTQRGKEAYALLKMKAISGLSIGFLTREDSYDQKTGVRTIKRADLWECSLVTFPMNDAARVSSVKSMQLIEEITDFKSAEKFLRESCNLSRSEATAFFTRVKGLAQRESAADEEANRLIVALNKRTEMIKS